MAERVPKIIEAFPVCACCQACRRLESFKPECNKAMSQLKRDLKREMV